MRGFVTAMAGRFSAVVQLLAGGIAAGLVAALSAWVVGLVVAPGAQATGAVRVPVLDGVPLLDVDKVRAEMEADAVRIERDAFAISVVSGGHWNQVVVAAHAATAAAAEKLVREVLESARARERAMIDDALAQADNLETVLLERFDEAERAGDASARADAEMAVVSFRLKRDALLKWTDGLVDPVRVRSRGAGPLRAGLAAALIAACVLGLASAADTRGGGALRGSSAS